MKISGKALVAVAALAGAAFSGVAISGSASAQDAADGQPVEQLVPVPAPLPAPVAVVEAPFLPANTEVLLSMNDDLTTKGGRIEEGHKFTLSVVHDVMVGSRVAIPQGTAAVGEVTFLTGKGVFGKSGKMEVELRYIDLEGRRIPIAGSFRQEGEGNTIAAVGAVFLAAPLLFVTGKSARIPRGRELMGHTVSRFPLPNTNP